MTNMPDPMPTQALHTEHIHVGRKQPPRWVWLGLPAIGLGMLGWLWCHPDQPTALQAPPAGAALVGNAVVGDTRVVTYKGAQWVVKGSAETFQPGDLELIGRSEEGDALYVNQSDGYLQGQGHQAINNAISTPSGRVYLKNPDGRFQPLFQLPAGR